MEFDAKRATAKFCSTNCRVKYAQRHDIDPETGEITEAEAPTERLIDPKLIALAQRLGITPEEAKRRLDGFQKMGMETVKWITTGIPELDSFQMIPRGRITQIQGPYAVGKTTLALNMIRGLKDKRVLYIDSEASLNPWLLLELGLNDDNFTLYNDSAYIEDIFVQVVNGAKSGQYDMIILDSLAACTSKAEAENDVTASNIGQKAKIVNKLMRIVPMELKNTDTALVIINQEREMIGTYVPTKYTPGGMGPQYAASLILGLKTIPSWRFPKDAKNGAYKGHEIEVKILKSKVSQPHRIGKVKLHYVTLEPATVGIDDEKEAF